jgi:hypothetical protein
MKILFTLLCGLLAISTSHANGFKVPAPPSASLPLFQTKIGEPFPIEVQTASPKGSMVFGQGMVNISANGTLSGTLNLTVFSTNNSTGSTLISNVPVTGTISRPRQSRKKTESGSGWAYAAADYLVDVSARTVSSATKPAPAYNVKGVLVYKYRVEYELSGSKITNSYDESYMDPNISVFGPNGEIGAVGSSDW